MQEHIMTLSTIGSDGVWSTPLFYVYDRVSKSLIFTSSQDTRHISHALEQRDVSCAISKNSMIVAKLKGAQIKGTLFEVEIGTKLEIEYKRLYLTRFPFAIGKLDRIWSINIKEIKYTDNSFGFGHKIFYSSESNN